MPEITLNPRIFHEQNVEDDLIVHAVPVENATHPVINKPSILFIRNARTGVTYTIPIEHPDSVQQYSIHKFVADFISPYRGKIWALDKKVFGHLTGIPNVFDINFLNHIQTSETFVESDYDTRAHFLIRKNSGIHPRINLAIPLLKHKEAFNNFADDSTELLKQYPPDVGFIKFNDLIIETLRLLEANGLFVDRELFKQRFGIDVGSAGIVHSQYNVYTATGRPSNRFDSVNYAALNSEDCTRKCFRSRWGDDGRLIAIDYTTFHPRIVTYLTKYSLSSDINIYEYLAQLYFQKKSVDDIDIDEAKTLTFRQLYGGVEDKYSHIKWLASLKSYIGSLWECFQRDGYITTPLFQRKITNKHILDPNPPKVFNYILQATEGEISIPRLRMVMDFLKSKRTRPILYTYDAVLYDFHKEDGKETLAEIRRIMSFDNKFPTKTYIGDTYHKMNHIAS
jgi:hypothetical protein